MTKDIIANRKRYGQKGPAGKVTIKVPDPAYDLLKDYDIDVVDYEVVQKYTCIYAKKNDEDITSVIFANNNYVDGIKKLLNQIQDIKEIKS